MNVQTYPVANCVYWRPTMRTMLYISVLLAAKHLLPASADYLRRLWPDLQPAICQNRRYDMLHGWDYQSAVRYVCLALSDQPQRLLCK